MRVAGLTHSQNKRKTALFAEDLISLANRAFSFLGICGRFKSFSGRFEGICGRFKSFSGRFVGFSGRFKSFSGRFYGILGRFESFSGRFKGILGRFARAAALDMHSVSRL